MNTGFETIIVAAFDDESDARKAIEELTSAGRKEIVNLQDVAYIKVKPNGDVAVEEQIERAPTKRGFIGRAARFPFRVTKASAKGVARAGWWLTLTGGSALAARVAQRLQATWTEDTQLTGKAQSIPRGGLTVISVVGKNSVGIASKLMTKAGGSITSTAEVILDDDGQPVPITDGESSKEQPVDSIAQTENAFQLTRNEKRYLKNALEKVSRSFALVIPNLEAPFNDYMATAYLICRVVDNIEDCTQPPAWKEQRFQEFHTLVNEPTAATTVLAYWHNEQWPGLTPDETDMMGPVLGAPLWEIYAKIPAPPRASIRRWVAEMVTGMNRMEGPEQNAVLEEYEGIRVLRDVKDYNAYCFYVAGTVGHMASELACIQYGLSDEVAQRLVDSCEACGRALQKTNILKDFAEDIERGISYLPYTWHRKIEFSALNLAGAPIEWKRDVINDVVGELRAASAYALALPCDAKGYRMACLMSLLPAYQTLLLAATNHAQLFTPAHKVKISRPTMAKCQQDAKSMLSDNEAIEAYCENAERQIELALA